MADPAPPHPLAAQEQSSARQKAAALKLFQFSVLPQGLGIVRAVFLEDLGLISWMYSSCRSCIFR